MDRIETSHLFIQTRHRLNTKQYSKQLLCCIQKTRLNCTSKYNNYAYLLFVAGTWHAAKVSPTPAVAQANSLSGGAPPRRVKAVHRNIAR